MSTVAMLPVRYEDAKEALLERASLSPIIYPFFLKYLMRKAITPSNLYLNDLENELPNMQKISNLRLHKRTIDTVVGLQNEFLKKFEKESIITRTILASIILEFEELRDRFEDFSENLELALDPTFKKCVKHTVSELPSEVRSKAEKELDEWLQHS